MRKKIVISATVTALMILLYMIFIMPLPFISGFWMNHTARDRMVEPVKEMVIGLSREEILDLLGSPDAYLPGILHGPGRGLNYLLYIERQIGPPRRVFLVILLDEDQIAVYARVMRN